MASTRLSALFSVLFYILFFSSCATVQDKELHHPSGAAEDEISTSLTVQMPDSSCSYFYLLWGTHAENNKRFEEAEEAFEKALICDPESRYIHSRLPILLLKMGKQQGAAKWLRKGIEKFPKDTHNRFLLARLAIQKKEIDKAIRLYRDILEITPEDETVLLRIGFLYSEQSRFLEAKQVFQEALTLNPESLFAHLYLARLAKKTGDREQAAQYYQKALSLNWSVNLALEAAEFYGSGNEYKKVETLYRSILAKHPEDKHAGLGLVHVLLLQDKEKEALVLLQNLRKNSTKPTRIDIVTARLYLRMDNIEKAEEVLTPLAMQDGIEEAMYMLAVIHYQQKEFTSTLALLTKIEPGSEFYEDALSLQVRIFMERKQFQKATSLLQQAIDNDDNSSPDLYTLLASLYMELNMFREGYKILDRALEVYPKNTNVYFEYGLLLEKENKKELALKRMEKILEFDPNHAEALNYIGYTWADLGVNLKQALIYIKKAIELKPSNGYIQDSLGWVYFRMGELEKAEQEIKEALKLEPSDPHIYEHLGDIYKKLGHLEKAERAYRKALDLFKNKEKQVQMQERIDAL